MPMIPPAQVMQKPPQAHLRVVPYEEAAVAVLDAFDRGAPLGPEPAVAAKDRQTLRWLRACATFKEGQLPTNPFAPKTQDHQEAEALRAFLALPAPAAFAAMGDLRLSTLGSSLAFWRWGKTIDHRQQWTRTARHTFEDRLLSAGNDLTQAYALRHALCFAVADKDEARFAALRAAVPDGEGPIYQGLQGAFGLLGNRLPALRLWTLPGRAPLEIALGGDGRPVWMCPLEEGAALPTLPLGTQWILPSARGDQDAKQPQLIAPVDAEARALEARLAPAQRTALFAASRAPFEKLGLMYFPLWMTFDPHGNLVELRMGDAAPQLAK